MAAAGPAWERYLTEMFPGYLLPSTMRRAIDREAAARFLRRLGGTAQHLDLLIESHLMAGRTRELEAFCRELGRLTRALPSRTYVERRRWEGGFHGRLDARQTIVSRMSGSPTSFITRARRRTFALPKNELVRAVAERLLVICESLKRADLLRDKQGKGEYHWGSAALAAPVALRVQLDKSALRYVPRVPIAAHHLQAAQAAPHPCYRLALDWHRAISDALNRTNPERLAQILADGALVPFPPGARFELAALVKLVEALWSGCERRAEGWTIQRTAVVSQRDSVAVFRRPDGARVEVFYNQPTLPTSGPRGPRDRGVAHYFANNGQFRPDIIVMAHRAGEPGRGVVMETKLSERRSYLQSGYAEALLYRYEYDRELIDWPKAILVCSSDIPGAASRDHEVVAVDWRRWPPPEIVDAMLPP